MVSGDRDCVSYIAIVPARSGSRRLPNKNIRPLAGKPLLLWTLEACISTKRIGKVILSTDSMDYWKLASEHLASPKLVLDHRTREEAGDDVKIFDYLKQFRGKVFGQPQGAFVLALPTVPLRKSVHINEALDLYENHGRPVFSATTYNFPVSFAFRLDKRCDWSPLFDDSPMVTGNTRSQNQVAVYHPNGAIYVRAIADLSEPDLMSLYQDARPYLMAPHASVDIDSEIDFALASALL